MCQSSTGIETRLVRFRHPLWYFHGNVFKQYNVYTMHVCTICGLFSEVKITVHNMELFFINFNSHNSDIAIRIRTTHKANAHAQVRLYQAGTANLWTNQDKQTPWDRRRLDIDRCLIDGHPMVFSVCCTEFCNAGVQRTWKFISMKFPITYGRISIRNFLWNQIVLHEISYEISTVGHSVVHTLHYDTRKVWLAGHENPVFEAGFTNIAHYAVDLYSCAEMLMKSEMFW